MIKNQMITEVWKKTPKLRVICFLLILVGLVIPVQKILLYRDRKTDNSSYQVMNFYKEEEDSLNPVFIGSSCCFSFYSPLFAYNTYGITTNNYASSGMGMIAYKYAIEEVRKTQKDALIVLTITPLDIMNYTALHYLLDYMPMSKNKLDFIKGYFTYGEENILNSLEYFFPLMRLHERWSDLTADDFVLDNGTKGATAHQYYLTYVTDISDDFFFSEERREMPENWVYLMTDLLDYCDEHNEKIMFLLPPRSYSEEEFTQLNTLVDYINSRGYDVLDLREKAEEIGLDVTHDFYDKRHTNVHGSLKYTDYVINVVAERYNIQLDHERNEEWDTAFNNYYELIKGDALDVELNMKQRDCFLERPELVSAVYDDGSVTIKWNEVENADGYLVYRKENNEWIRVGDTENTEYSDSECAEGTNLYTVISYRNDNGVIRYGNYEYKGIGVEVKR